MKTYRTRISIVLLLVLAVALFTPLIVYYVQEPHWYYILLILLIALLILSGMYSCKYVIDGDILKVYYIYGIHKDIPIKSIKKIEPCKSMLGAPAASFRRIAIYYGISGYILISPRHRNEFIEQVNHIRNN